MNALNARTRGAFLAALDLAAHYGGERPIRVQEIAARTGVSATYLVQILLLLKRRALVNSTRGAHGGYWLLRRPELISAADIIGAVQTRRRPASVAPAPTPYDRAVTRFWADLGAQQRKSLAQVSLADMLRMAHVR
jgi:Rrf2 family protein